MVTLNQRFRARVPEFTHLRAESDRYGVGNGVNLYDAACVSFSSPRRNHRACPSVKTT
jgi:hypothetical protein